MSWTKCPKNIHFKGKKDCERGGNTYNETMTTKNLKNLSQKGLRIYRKKYGNKFEKSQKGKIVAIEVDSGDVFVGHSAIEAGLKAKSKYPKKLFYFKRVGYPAVHSLKGFVPLTR